MALGRHGRTVEARAYPLAAASIVAVLVVARVAQHASRRRECAAAVAVGFVALVHPIALGTASFLWLSLAFLGWRHRRLGPPHIAAALVVFGAGIAGIFQSESSTSVAKRGLDGLTSTLASLFGGSVVTGLAVIVVATLVVAAEGRHDPPALIALSSALTDVALCVITLPLDDIAPFYPRYLVITAALVVLAAALPSPQRWRCGLLAATIIICPSTAYRRHPRRRAIAFTMIRAGQRPAARKKTSCQTSRLRRVQMPIASSRRPAE